MHRVESSEEAALQNSFLQDTASHSDSRLRKARAMLPDECMPAMRTRLYSALKLGSGQPLCLFVQGGVL